MEKLLDPEFPVIIEGQWNFKIIVGFNTYY